MGILHGAGFSICPCSARILRETARILSIKGLDGVFGEHFLQEIDSILVGFGEGKFLLMGMAQSADGFSIVDAGDIPTVEDVALVDSDKSFGKLVLKRFEGFEGTDDIAVLHEEIRGVVVGFEVEDILGVQIPVIIVGF